MEGFTIYILSKDIDNDTQKQAILLHQDGMVLQDELILLPKYNKVPKDKTKLYYMVSVVDLYDISTR